MVRRFGSPVHYSFALSQRYKRGRGGQYSMEETRRLFEHFEKVITAKDDKRPSLTDCRHYLQNSEGLHGSRRDKDIQDKVWAMKKAQQK